MLETPVAFLVFNRPDTTRRVFAEIRKAQPKKLLIVADGPRPDRPGEAELCAEVRGIVENIDWDCEVLRNYSETNLGCKIRVSTGLNWVFENFEESIILEDDCLPNETFFRFCAEMLERYRQDKRIMTISGYSYIGGKNNISSSYYFSIYPLIWGWATWRRAWKYYDIELNLWDNLINREVLFDILRDQVASKYWLKVFNQKLRNQHQNNVWDYIWMLSCWSQSGLSVIPDRNLVSNIGFGPDATNTHEQVSTFSNVDTSEMEFPLKHPKLVVRDPESDRITFQNSNPWAVTPPGLYYLIREVLYPFTPAFMRSYIYRFRKHLLK